MLQRLARRMWSFVLLFAQVVLATTAAFAGQDDPDRLKARVRDLHGKGNAVKVTMADRTVLKGQIVRVADDSFTLRQEKSAQETAVPYAQVKDVRKSGPRK